jgi:hypothetical protein
MLRPYGLIQNYGQRVGAVREPPPLLFPKLLHILLPVRIARDFATARFQ